MATATRKGSTWDALEGLDRRARDARSKEDQVRARRGEARRRIEAAKSALSGYQEAVFAEERAADEDEERRLIEEIRDAEAASTEAVAEAREAAMRRVREAAEVEVERFASEHFEELLREHAPEAFAATEALTEAHLAREEASRRYAVAQRRSFRLAEISGRSSEDVPRHPLTGDVADVEHRFATGIEPPLPRSLIEAHLEPT